MKNDDVTPLHPDDEPRGMRNREAISRDVVTYHDAISERNPNNLLASIVHNQALVVELLLDIRDAVLPRVSADPNDT